MRAKLLPGRRAVVQDSDFLDFPGSNLVVRFLQRMRPSPPLPQVHPLQLPAPRPPKTDETLLKTG